MIKITAKYEKQILKIATDRGWTFIRKGGHNQSILEYPETGARMYLYESPRTRPSPSQIVTKMASLERSTRTKTLNQLMEWVCNRYGIPADGGKVVIDNLSQITREYLGREPKDKQEGDRYKNALTHSDRVWLVGLSDRGHGASTPRLILGPDAVLTEEQLETVRSYPQVNGVFTDLPTVTERLAEMHAFVESRGFTRKKSGAYSHRGKGVHSLSVQKAFEMAQGMPEVINEPQAAPEPAEVAPTEPYADPNEGVAKVSVHIDTPEDIDESNGAKDGIVVVEGEPGVHTTRWLEENEQAAKTVGLPVELVAMLREALKIDNGNVISGLDMVRDALTASIDAATVLVKSLEDLDTAIELIKVEG